MNVLALLEILKTSKIDIVDSERLAEPTYVEKFAVAEARSGSHLPFTGKRGRDPARRAPNGIGCLGPKMSNGIACRPNSASWATRGARA